MSLELSDVKKTEFVGEVHQTFRPMIKDVKSLCRVKPVKGSATVQFPVMGKGVSSLRTNYHTNIPASNISFDPVTVTVKDYTYATYTDIFLANKVNFAAQQELAQEIAGGLQRRMLQLLIDALDVPTYTNTVDLNSNLEVPVLRDAAKVLDATGVIGARKWMAHPNNIHNLATESDVKSSDFNTMRTLVKGGMNAYYGFDFYSVPNLDEGGLPKSGNDRTNWAFSQDALGLAINMEPVVKVDWIPEKGAYFVCGYLSANAIVIDETGVVEVTIDETA